MAALQLFFEALHVMQARWTAEQFQSKKLNNIKI